ncbi:hypothetical protein [Bacillus sp. FSL R9-9410]|uniref:hypothetical protein n=1 Tax=Bacillus sp. FSL R9-9410 TaxID=2921590 RepID=UPI0031014637
MTGAENEFLKDVKRKDVMKKEMLALYDTGKLKELACEKYESTGIHPAGQKMRNTIIEFLENSEYKELMLTYEKWKEFAENYDTWMECRKELIEKILCWYDQGVILAVHNSFLEIKELKLHPYSVREFIKNELENRSIKGIEEFYSICVQVRTSQVIDNWLNYRPKISIIDENTSEAEKEIILGRSNPIKF